VQVKAFTSGDTAMLTLAELLVTYRGGLATCKMVTYPSTGTNWADVEHYYFDTAQAAQHDAIKTNHLLHTIMNMLHLNNTVTIESFHSIHNVVYFGVVQA